MNFRTLFCAVITAFAFMACFTSCEKEPEKKPTGNVEFSKVYLFGNCKDHSAHQQFATVAEGETDCSVASLLSVEDMVGLGTKIIGIRVYVGAGFTEGEVFVGEDYDAPTKVKPFTYKDAGWQYVLFDEPMDVPSEDFYIGANIIGTGGLIGVEGSNRNVKTEYIKYQGKWYTIREAFNSNGYWSIQAILTGGDYNGEVLNDMVLESLTMQGKGWGYVGESTSAVCEVRNAGVNTATGITITVSGSGSVSQKFDTPLMNGQSAVINIPSILLPNETGTAVYNFELTFDEVDEYLKNNKSEQTYRVYENGKTTTRNTILLEVFTSQKCGYCPYGAMYLGEAIKMLPDQNKISRIMHHAGFSEDDFTLNESETIVNMLGFSGAPNMSVNRSIVAMEGVPAVVWHPVYAYLYFDVFKALVDEPTVASLNLEHTYNVDTREVVVKVSGDSYVDEANVTVVLVQNALIASQEDYLDVVANPSAYEHNFVPRAFLTAAKGDALTITDGKYAVEYTYTIPESVGNYACAVENMQVVAFVHKANGDVYNADRVDVVSGGSAVMELPMLNIAKNTLGGLYLDVDPVSEYQCR